MVRKGLLTTVRDVIGLRIENLARLRCGKKIRPWSVNINRPWFGKNFGSCFGKVDRLYSAGMSIDHGAETSIDYGSERSLDHSAEKSIDCCEGRCSMGNAHHAGFRRVVLWREQWRERGLVVARESFVDGGVVSRTYSTVAISPLFSRRMERLRFAIALPFSAERLSITRTVASWYSLGFAISA